MSADTSTGSEESGPSLRTSTVAVIRRPDLWPTVARLGLRLVPRQWWKRGRTPLPDADYLKFRMETAYGDGAAVAPAGDLVHYLEWCRSFERL